MMNDRQPSAFYFFCVPLRPDEAYIVILILMPVEGGAWRMATPLTRPSTTVRNGWLYDEIVKGFKLVDQKPCAM